MVLYGEREREAVRDHSTGTIYCDECNKLKLRDQVTLQMWMYLYELVKFFMVLAQSRIVV